MIGHNVGGIAGDRLRSFIERIERLEEEKRSLAEDIKEVYAEARGSGFDAKIMRKLIALRRMDKDDLDEQEALLDIYKRALGMLIDTPLGQAALARLDDTVATASSHPKRRGRPPKAKNGAEPAAGNGTARADLVARAQGKEDGIAGHRDHAARYPSGEPGHGDYWLGHAEGEGEQDHPPGQDIAGSDGALRPERKPEVMH